MRVPTISCIGPHVEIRPLTPQDVDSQLQLRLANREFMKPYDPRQPDHFFTRAGQDAHVRMSIQQWLDDRAFGFGVFELSTGELIGRVALSNVVRGAWQNATLGYWIAGNKNGRGYGTEAVQLVTRFAFFNAGLHRVQAAIMPRNARSIRVIEKAGYRFEGESRRYLSIDGVWEDHHIYAMTAEEVDEAGPIREGPA
jgi:ribosomal-protein-alanine N-acetyltransferase